MVFSQAVWHFVMVHFVFLPSVTFCELQYLCLIASSYCLYNDSLYDCFLRNNYAVTVLGTGAKAPLCVAARLSFQFKVRC